MAKRRNTAASSARRAGRTKGSVRKHKKFMKSQGFSGTDIQYVRGKRKRTKNPTALLFRSKAAAKKYVKDHRIKGYRITKVKRAK